MNYYALDEALAFINEEELPLDFQIKSIIESGAVFGESVEILNEAGDSFKEKFKAALNKFIQRIKDFFKWVGTKVKALWAKIKALFNKKKIDEVQAKAKEEEEKAKAETEKAREAAHKATEEGEKAKEKMEKKLAWRAEAIDIKGYTYNAEEVLPKIIAKSAENVANGVNGAKFEVNANGEYSYCGIVLNKLDQEFKTNGEFMVNMGTISLKYIIEADDMIEEVEDLKDHFNKEINRLTVALNNMPNDIKDTGSNWDGTGVEPIYHKFNRMLKTYTEQLAIANEIITIVNKTTQPLVAKQNEINMHYGIKR